MSAGNPRRNRISRAIRDELAQSLWSDVKDPRVQAVGAVNISVNTVELNSDMSVARVFVSFIGVDEKQIESALRGLNAASRYLRGPLGRKLKLGRTPELRFVLDTGPDFCQKISDIVSDDEKRKIDD